MIRNEVKQFYINHFKETHHSCPLLDGLEFDSISRGEKRWVEKSFLKEEVHKSIMSMKGDKAPGPDGFSISIFQRC